MPKKIDSTPIRKIANFSALPADASAIRAIANKAVQFAQELGTFYDARTIETDLLVCHLNICPLDLNGLEERATLIELLDDVVGIHTHIDRHQLVLKDGYTPTWRTHA